MAAVPSPTRTTITTVVASGQEVTEEQRARLCDWLRANSIDPFLVVQSSQLGPSVGGIAIIQPGGQGLGYVQFHQYDRHPDGGSKYADPQTGEPAFYERRIWLSVALPPEPVEGMIKAEDDRGHLFNEPGFVDPSRCARCGVDGMRWQLSADRQPCTGPGPEESTEEVKP